MVTARAEVTPPHRASPSSEGQESPRATSRRRLLQAIPLQTGAEVGLHGFAQQSLHAVPTELVLEGSVAIEPKRVLTLPQARSGTVSLEVTRAVPALKDLPTRELHIGTQDYRRDRGRAGFAFDEEHWVRIEPTPCS